MRTFASIVLLSSIICGGVANAECSTSLNGKVANGYNYGGLGLVASDEWVTQGGGTYTCGRMSYDGWFSWGPAGGTAIEFDASMFYNDRIGAYDVQLAAQYFAVNLDDSMGDANDDLVELYADVSRPFRGERLTVAPLVRVEQLIGVDDLPSITLVGPGVRVSYQLTESASLAAEVRDSFNITDDTSVVRFDGTLAWQASERTAIRLGWNDTDHTPSVVSVGLFHQLN